MAQTRREFLKTAAAGAAADRARWASPWCRAAQQKKLIVWWNRGYYKEEDEAMLKIAEDFRKAKNVDLDISFTIQEDLLQEDHQRADRPGACPDVAFCFYNDWEIIPKYALGRPARRDHRPHQRAQAALHREVPARWPTCYDNVAKKRAYYGVPIEAQTMHIHYWRDLREGGGDDRRSRQDPHEVGRATGTSGSKAQDALRKKDPAKYGKVYGIGMTESSSALRHHLQLRDGAPLLRRAQCSRQRRQGGRRPAEEPRGDRQDAEVLRGACSTRATCRPTPSTGRTATTTPTSTRSPS